MSGVVAFAVSPGLVDLILLFTMAEACLLLGLRSFWRPPFRAADIVLMLLPGVFLMLALRSAIAGTAWPWMPIALSAALVAHLLDLGTRFRR